MPYQGVHAVDCGFVAQMFSPERQGMIDLGVFADQRVASLAVQLAKNNGDSKRRIVCGEMRRLIEDCAWEAACGRQKKL